MSRYPYYLGCAIYTATSVLFAGNYQTTGQRNSSSLQDLGTYKPRDSGVQSAIKHWPLLIKTNSRKDHAFQITAHMSIQWMIGFCIDCQSTEHFLIAINYWLPGKKYFMYWKNLPNLLSYKTKPKGFLSMIWMKHHGTISDKLSQILDRLKMLVSCHLQIAYTS